MKPRLGDHSKTRPILLIASLTLGILIMGCAAYLAQANTATPAPLDGQTIQVTTTDRQATIDWQHLQQATGYRVAWINMEQMSDAIRNGAHWTERLAYTNVPPSRTSHQVSPLEPDTQHAFTVGTKGPDGTTFAWSSWQITYTQPDACPCTAEAYSSDQPQPNLDIGDSHPLAAHLAAAKNAIAEHDPEVQQEPAALILTSYESVTWPDGSLGCAQEGYAYTAAEVDGHIMQFQFHDKNITVHLSHKPIRAIVPVDCV